MIIFLVIFGSSPHSINISTSGGKFYEFLNFTSFWLTFSMGIRKTG